MKRESWRLYWDMVLERIRNMDWKHARDTGRNRGQSWKWISVVLAVAAAGIWTLNLGLMENQQGLSVIAGQSSSHLDQEEAEGGGSVGSSEASIEGGASQQQVLGTGTEGGPQENYGYSSEPEATPSSPVEYCGFGVLSCFEEEVRYDAPSFASAKYDVDDMGETVCDLLDDRADLRDILDFSDAGGFASGLPPHDTDVAILVREATEHICPEYASYVEDDLKMAIW